MANLTGTPMDRLRSDKKPIIRTVVIPLDDDVARRYEEIKTRYELTKVQVNIDHENLELKKQMKKQLKDLEAQLQDVETELKENMVEFKFRNIGRKRLEDLINEYPANDKQIEDAKKRGISINWDPDTFPVALMAASVVEPELSYDDFKALWEDDNWSHTELNGLFEAAWSANNQFRNLQLGKE